MINLGIAPKAAVRSYKYQCQEEMLMFVYVMRNTLNDKCYVGQDSGSVEAMRRVKCHILEGVKLASGGNLRNKSLIAKAVAKYGAEAFEITVDSYGYKSKEHLNTAEITLIKKLNSIKNGYNILPGGQGLPSNDCVQDSEMLNFYHSIRSRGAKTSNEIRWGKATDEDRQAIWTSMRDGREAAGWQQNIQASWHRLTPEQRSERGNQMKEGRPNRFVLTRPSGEVLIETNLRTLLANIETPILKRTIERLVRNGNHYNCSEFSIEKRTR